MYGLEPQVHKIWTFSENGVTPEVHLTARVNIGSGFVGEFATNNLTEDGRSIPITSRKSINGIVEWLGVPDPLRTDAPPWTDNILVPSPDWGAGGTAKNPNWGSQPGGPYGNVSVMWSSPIYAMSAYVCRSTENTRIVAHRIRDDLLQEDFTVCVQNISTSCSILRNCLINWRDCVWDNLWDERVDQKIVWRISVGC